MCICEVERGQGRDSITTPRSDACSNPLFLYRLTCAMCKEVECLAKKFSDTLLDVGVGESVCACGCVNIRDDCDYSNNVCYCQKVSIGV